MRFVVLLTLIVVCMYISSVYGRRRRGEYGGGHRDHDYGNHGGKNVCQKFSWSAWTKCSGSCGSGMQQRSRNLNGQPPFYGRRRRFGRIFWGGRRRRSRQKYGSGSVKCPIEKRRCALPPCRVDCKVGPWSRFCPCSASCGGGRKTRTRKIITRPQHGGTRCPALSDTQTCNNNICSIDCKVGPWSKFGRCSASCGGGRKTRTRKIITRPQHGGTRCPALSDTQSCNNNNCPIDCRVGPWSKFGRCSASCGGGRKTRTRKIITRPQYGGTKCPALTDTQTCNKNICSIDCKVGPWSKFGRCSASCGGGRKTRTRKIITRPQHGGTRCPALSDTQSCNNNNCPIDCRVGPWSKFGRCSASCGGGRKTRTRKIITRPQHGGTRCPALSDTQSCNNNNCPIDCRVGPWSKFGSCSASCGGGRKTRTRKIITRPQHGGTRCPALSDTQSCNNNICQIDCRVGPWSKFGSCSASCGGGRKTRTRKIITRPQHGGTRCPALSDTQSCNNNNCPIDCKVGPWSTFGPCSASCGGGTKKRTRTVTTPAQHGGQACPALSDTQSCNNNNCPINCQVGPWSKFSSCSASCGGGRKTRTRKIITRPQHGGTRCPALSDTQSCNKNICPIDCQVGPWSTFGTCSASCGGGTKTRSRTVTTPAQHGGQACPALSDTQSCNNNNCPINCQVSQWTTFGLCSASCGGGTKTRTRTVTTPEQYGGKKCPALDDTQSCNNNNCPIDCQVCQWSTFGLCSASCGGGTKTRSRTVTTPAQHGGQACPALTDTQSCNNNNCPIDCQVGQWTTFCPCSASCGGGTKTRSRTVTTPAQHGGQACPALTDTQSCNNNNCPIDCQVNTWGEWGACDTANNCRRQRTTTVKIPASNGGKPCNLTQVEDCQIPDVCDLECELQYKDWGPCSVTCGTGTRTRITHEPNPNKSRCNQFSTTQTEACTVECAPSKG
uniref:thrombospondin type-1 domain-containing protein 7A isoform X2 n=1 Tax=Ciona intestinalis TaxID=7719 RepID=UPI000EF4A309|nr:thrombospondin type-1 domain-containing protein 7A isoform X2 [Ciona intestinalis]|eukprot:XP_026693109.1 thrombospondin type-1 domain-containing protein 7A isoform X2 [Ciona intestinalis]